MSVDYDHYSSNPGLLRRLAKKLLCGAVGPDPHRPKMREMRTHAVFIFLKMADHISSDEFRRHLAQSLRTRFIEVRRVLGFDVVKQFHSNRLDAPVKPTYIEGRSASSCSILSWARGQPKPKRYKVEFTPFADAVVEIQFPSEIFAHQRAEIRRIARSLKNVCERVVFMESDRRRHLFESPDTGRDVWLLETNVALPGVSRSRAHDFWVSRTGPIVVDNRKTLGWAEYYQVLASEYVKGALDDGIDGFSWVRFPQSLSTGSLALQSDMEFTDETSDARESAVRLPVHGITMREVKELAVESGNS